MNPMFSIPVGPLAGRFKVGPRLPLLEAHLGELTSDRHLFDPVSPKFHLCSVCGEEFGYGNHVRTPTEFEPPPEPDYYGPEGASPVTREEDEAAVAMAQAEGRVVRTQEVSLTDIRNDPNFDIRIGGYGRTPEEAMDEARDATILYWKRRAERAEATLDRLREALDAE
jgi:hypothetical protein